MYSMKKLKEVLQTGWVVVSLFTTIFGVVVMLVGFKFRVEAVEGKVNELQTRTKKVEEQMTDNRVDHAVITSYLQGVSNMIWQIQQQK